MTRDEQNIVTEAMNDVAEKDQYSCLAIRFAYWPSCDKSAICVRLSKTYAEFYGQGPSAVWVDRKGNDPSQKHRLLMLTLFLHTKGKL